ncbi:MAG: tetratricopeptide repeat protein, partial [Blastocatellia bacterium]
MLKYALSLAVLLCQLAVAQTVIPPAPGKPAGKTEPAAGKISPAGKDILLPIQPAVPAPVPPVPAPRQPFAQKIPFSAFVAYEQARVRLQGGRAPEAVTLLEEAITRFPEYFDALMMLGVEYGRQNREDEAVRLIERARLVNDTDARVYQAFGIIVARQRKFAVAEYAFRQALARDPADAVTRYSHALTLLELCAGKSGSEMEQLRREAE